MLFESIRNKLEQVPPLALCYNGKELTGFSEEFEQLSEQRREEKKRIIYVTAYRHKPSGTQWTVTRTYYPDYGALEWQADIYAPERTGIFSDICYKLPVPGRNGRLIGNYGDEGSYYKEYCAELAKGTVMHENTDGRATHGVFPYYRLETDQGNLIAVLSWQGAWFARFTQQEGEVMICAGQKNVNTYLEAGEHFRLPLMLIMGYEEDPSNTWRRFFMDCNMPEVSGKRIRPLVGVFNGSCAGLSEALVTRVRDTYERNGVDYDFWWFDAGWGTDGTGPHNKEGWWYHGVNFEVNLEAFPDGMARFGAELAERGKDFMLWFEPELIRTPPEKLELFFSAHPDFKREWIIGTFQKEWCGTVLTAQLIDIGEPQCLAWLEARIFEVMDRAKVNIYREDFNIPPAGVWAAHDAPDRRGMTENRYCTGYLQFRRDIQARYPGIMMDSCASGGGRNDLETMRLMFPLHYSDYMDMYPGDADGFIYMQQVLYRWFPYIKNSISPYCLNSLYAARAAFNPCMVLGMPPEELENTDFDKLKAIMSEWREINRAYFGDYYELERATSNNTDIKAFMFNNREENIGLLAVFCPGECVRRGYTAVLRGLEAGQYKLTDMDTRKELIFSAEELSRNGLTLSLEPGTAKLIKLCRA